MSDFTQDELDQAQHWQHQDEIEHYRLLDEILVRVEQGLTTAADQGYLRAALGMNKPIEQPADYIKVGGTDPF